MASTPFPLPPGAKLIDPGKFVGSGDIKLPEGAKLVQDSGSEDHAVRDALKSEGFLDSAWHALTSPFTFMKSALTGDYHQQTADQIKKFQELEKSGSPEQKREFAKEALLQNIPFASTVYKALNGNLPGAAGDVTGMVALGAAANAVPKAINAIKENAPVARGAVEGAAKAIPGAVETSILRYTGVPQVVRGAIEGAKASIADRVAATNQALTAANPAELSGYAPRTAAPPTAPGPVPVGLGLPSEMLPPAPVPAVNPAELSFSARRAPVVPISGGPVPTGLGLPAEMMPAASTSTAAATQIGGVPVSLLDEIAVGQKIGKSFAGIRDPQAQSIVLRIGQAMQSQEAQPAARPTPVPVQPEAAPPAAMQAAPAEPLPASAPQPVPIAEQLRDEMVRSGTVPSAEVPAPQPEFQPSTFEASARASKVQNLAKALHENGISYEDARNMDMSHWKMLADHLGENVPSQASVEGTLFELRKLDRASTPTVAEAPKIKVRRRK